MSKNSDYRDSDEWKTLNILYDMGLLNANRGKRFTVKKERIFVEIMKNPDISNQSIASKLFITVDTVKTFSSEIYREISITIGEKITRQTMKSAIRCFLDKSPSSNDFVGVLISPKSIKESLHISLENLIKSFLKQGFSQDNICEQFNHIMNNIEDADISIK
jgi:hypothetical protein